MSAIVSSTGVVLQERMHLHTELPGLGPAHVVVLDINGEVATVEVSGPVRVQQECHLRKWLGVMKRWHSTWIAPAPRGKSRWMIFGRVPRVKAAH